MERPLRRPWTAPSGTPDRLRALSRELNQRAYAGLGALLTRMGVTAVDAARVRAVDERVCGEPRLSGTPGPGLEVHGGERPVPVRALAGDLDDILANLLRNARTALADVEAPRLRVEIVEEDDPITGLEEVVIRVSDNAPGRLTTADIRSRALGRGLGLIADLIARHDGSITVEAAAGGEERAFSKAVVVRLPRAEGAPGGAVVPPRPSATGGAGAPLGAG